MDILSAVLACSLYSDDAVVRAIAESNSQGNPYSVIDAAGEDAGAQPHSKADALARAGSIIENRGLPLMGLMQIPPSWVALFGRTVEDAFDPCINVSIGTAMLSQYAYECRRAASRSCVAHKYADALGMPEFAQVIELQVTHLPTYEPLPAGSPILISETSSWGARALFSTAGAAR